MPSKHPPIGVRFPPDQLSRLDAWAKDNGASRHGAVLRLVDVGMGVTPPKAKTHKSAAATQVVEVKANARLVPAGSSRDRWAVFSGKAAK